MSWRCFRCGGRSDGASCPECGSGRPAPDLRLAVLGGTVNMNFGTVNNVYGPAPGAVPDEPVPVFLTEPPPSRPLLSEGVKDSMVRTANWISWILLSVVAAGVACFFLAVFLM